MEGLGPMSGKAKIMYSASANGGAGAFFDLALGYAPEALPDDCVPVSAKRHAALMAGQASGHQVIADNRGRPQLQALFPTTLAECRAAKANDIRREASRRIKVAMPIWRQLNALRENRDPGFWKIDAIRNASNLIEAQMMELPSAEAVRAYPVPGNPLWPTFDEPESV